MGDIGHEVQHYEVLPVGLDEGIPEPVTAPESRSTAEPPGTE